MGVQRFFVNRQQVNLDQPVVHIPESGLINQVRNVLRLKPGDAVILLDGQGSLYRCHLLSVSKSELSLGVQSKEAAGGEPAIKVTVALPLLKGGRFEWALEKLAELGVSAVIPVVAERAVVRSGKRKGLRQDADRASKKLQHWQHILRESAEQCERSAIPQIVEPIRLDDLLSGQVAGAAEPGSLKFICAERRQAPFFRTAIHASDIFRVPPPGVCIVVGPEGGLTPDELRLADDSGWQLVSLGSRILRTETAAIYALAQIISVADNNLTE